MSVVIFVFLPSDQNIGTAVVTAARSDKCPRQPVSRGLSPEPRVPGHRRFFYSVFLAMAAQEQGRAWYLFPPTADQIEAEKER